ncbi:MAG: hypothetical protein NT067_02435 [Candidatus Diapherotrites archaeon]|nr:hypothetical protein [Candidatus Diapherotrites archaeon]
MGDISGDGMISRMRTKKPQTPRFMVRHYRGRRAIPGTVFAVHEAVRVENPQLLERMNRQRKRPVMFRLAPGTRAKYGMPEQSWLVPTRLASVQNDGIHRRSIMAKVGGRWIILKGSGAQRRYDRPSEDCLVLPFTWYKEADYSTSKLYGGSRMEFEKHSLEVAKALREEFGKMRRNKDKVLRFVRESYGINSMPTLEPIALFQPKQTPAEYFTIPGGKNGKGQYKVINFPGAEGKVRANFAGSLESGEARVFKLLEPTARRQSVESEIPQAVKLKLAGIEKHSNIRKSVAETQAVLAYAVRTPFRVSELADAPYFSWKKLELPSRSAQELKELFRVNGFSLKPDSPKSNTYTVWERQGRKWVEISPLEAREKIAVRFAANLATGIHVMHEGLKGTFTSNNLTCLNTINTTLAGEILDLDTAATGLRASADRTARQAKDVEFAQALIRHFVKSIGGVSNTAQKALVAFELISGSGKMGFGL